MRREDIFYQYSLKRVGWDSREAVEKGRGLGIEPELLPLGWDMSEAII